MSHRAQSRALLPPGSHGGKVRPQRIKATLTLLLYIPPQQNTPRKSFDNPALTSHLPRTMSAQPMSHEAQVAYQEALERIEAYRRKEGRMAMLFLQGLGLTHIPPEIGQLSTLKALFLHDNQLTSLPSEIGQLSALTGLNLDNNCLTSLPPEIGQMSGLLGLHLSNNQLTSLPPEVGQLSALEELHLFSNQLTSLPPEMGKLSALTKLSLHGNRLTSLPPEMGKLSALTKLSLHGNRLTSLPPEIGQLSALKELFLHDNPTLKLPPSVLGPEPRQCKRYGGKLDPARPADILEYYFSTRGKEGQALREVKVILVGRGEVGKSSMADVLRGLKFVKNRKRTDGIVITPWPVKLKDGAAELTLWDFGGQEIMHGTHQFFLTHRSLYVVMVDGRHDRGRQDAEYWLKLVRAFGGEHSPVLVVMNRQKAHPFSVDSEVLSKKYGVQLDHFFRTDCESASTIKPLQKAILTEAQRMLAAEEKFPARCWQMKTRLAEMKQHGEDYLSEDDYTALCQEHGITDEQEQQKLLRRLADLGTVVSFPDEVKLSALSVLNPEWATDGIYRVVTNEDLREKRHGLLKSNTLRQLLPKNRWPKNEHVRYVLELMVKFDLCFPVDEAGNEMLVPELLPDKTPPQGDWAPAQCVVFQYDYPVLPHGVLPRFITRTHKLSEGRERWRTGVVLADDGAEARVQADYEANTLTIWVRGHYADARRSLLKVIRYELESIHARIKELNPIEKVSVPKHPEVLVNYGDVIKDERRGKTTFAVTVKGERIDLPIGDLLNGVESKTERERATARERYRQGDKHYHYHEGDTHMNIDDHSFNARDITGSQAGYTLTNCTNMIQHQEAGPVKTLLEELETQVKALLPKLPADKQKKAARNLELTMEAATSDEPDRAWYSVSSAGLLEAAEYVDEFSGKIASTIGNLTKALWPGEKE